MNTPIHLQKEHNVNLAFMECFASCVLTYLRVIGYDHRKLLLDYWNLDYQYRTLMSSKDARKFPLDYLYGIELKHVEGDINSLTDHVRQGNSIILLCMASRLDYFPRDFLSMESGGFLHSVLIHDQDPLAGFAVFDPIVDYVGYTTTDVLAQAGTTGRDETLHYFTLEKKSVDQLPSIQEVLQFCSGRNLYFYQGQLEQLAEARRKKDPQNDQRKKAWMEWFSSRHGGSQSFHLFAKDLKDSLNWSQQRRDNWVKQNSMTISSIRHVRMQIWDIYREFIELDETDVEEGNRQIRDISHLWQRLNYMLLKFKSTSDKHQAADILCGKMEELKQSEVQFLSWLNQKVSMEHGSDK